MITVSRYRVIVTDLETGKVYPTLTAASNDLHINAALLSRVGRQRGREIDVYGRRLMFETGPSCFPQKEVVCVETGQTYPSIKAASDAMFTAPASITRALGCPRYRAAGYHWRRIEQ